MTIEDFHAYCIPACRRIMGAVGNHEGEMSRHLGRLLDISDIDAFWDRPSLSDFPIRPELKELFIKLAGPHGRAILKAYRIQKGLEK